MAYVSQIGNASTPPPTELGPEHKEYQDESDEPAHLGERNRDNMHRRYGIFSLSRNAVRKKHADQQEA